MGGLYCTRRRGSDRDETYHSKGGDAASKAERRKVFSGLHGHSHHLLTIIAQPTPVKPEARTHSRALNLYHYDWI